MVRRDLNICAECKTFGVCQKLGSIPEECTGLTYEEQVLCTLIFVAIMDKCPLQVQKVAYARMPEWFKTDFGDLYRHLNEE